MRLVYSLKFELEPTKPGTSLALIAPLSRLGTLPRCWPTDRRKRLADVRPGDWIFHRAERYKVIRIEAYRAHEVTAEILQTRKSSADGFVVDP
jgi:hypothetical protein